MNLKLPATLIGNGPHAVEGLPNDQSALIMRIDGVWKLLRTVKDASSGWTGVFTSPEAALAALRTELSVEEIS